MDENGVIDFNNAAKPMGVATYRVRDEMPEQWQKALPDFDDMKKLLDSAADEQGSGADK